MNNIKNRRKPNPDKTPRYKYSRNTIDKPIYINVGSGGGGNYIMFKIRDKNGMFRTNRKNLPAYLDESKYCWYKNGRIDRPGGDPAIVYTKK